MADLLAAYRHTLNNWVELGDSAVCGCCNCMQIFPVSDIVAWTGLDLSRIDDPAAVAEQTALCPRCGSEALIGDKSGIALNARFLTEMNDAWYQRTIVRRPAAKT